MILRTLTVLVSLLVCCGCSPRTEPTQQTSRADGLESASPVPELASPVPELASPVPELASRFRSVYRSGDVYFAGLPSEGGMRQLADEGMDLVVNILTMPEQPSRVPFDEPALLESLDVTYIHIPVSPNTFSRQDVDLFAEKLAAANGKVLVHCASSNRAGGLWASYLFHHKGMSREDAMAHGKAAGLSAPSMVQAVERIIGS